jgi:hypothetical protein
MAPVLFFGLNPARGELGEQRWLAGWKNNIYGNDDHADA